MILTISSFDSGCGTSILIVGELIMRMAESIPDAVNCFRGSDFDSTLSDSDSAESFPGSRSTGNYSFLILRR